jgi:hypothetical protein
MQKLSPSSLRISGVALLYTNNEKSEEEIKKSIVMGV